MFGNFTDEAREILNASKIEMSELKHPYIGSEHLLLSILKDDNIISKRLKEYGINYSKVKNEMINIIGVGSSGSDLFIYTPLLKRILENAIIDSKENNNGEVTINHLFSSLLEEGEGVAIRVLLGLGVDIDQLYNEFVYKIAQPKKRKNGKKLLLEELGNDLNKKAMDGQLDPVIGRDLEIKRLLEILSRRTKNNPLLIGDAGVGKTAIVEELSRMIVSGEVPMELRNKRIISLDMASVVAGTKYRGEFEDRMYKLLKEIEDNDDIILFIDEIHTLVGAGGAEGAIDASNIFKPALARNKVKCIGATTTSEYKKYIEKDSALERRFQRIFIEKPNKETVKEILNKLKGIYEKYHLVSLGDEIIDLIVNLSEKYIHDRNEPDKSIDILDEVCAKVSLKETKEMKKYYEIKRKIEGITKQKNESIIKNDFTLASTLKETENKLLSEINDIELNLYKKIKKEVTVDDVAEVVFMKTKVPVFELLNDKKKVIVDLEKKLREKILGQDRALEEILYIAKKIKLGFRDNNKCYSFMFVGPSGVGKTELAKLFGSSMVGETNVIRLDMSEFSDSSSLSKIVGANPGYVGYDDNKNILEEIRNKPFSVVLLDEIEKAHPNVINLLFQIFDEGKLKDSNGREIYFNNAIIIMTSNIGFYDKSIGFNSLKATINSKLKENFSPPFINRIDNIIVFEPLNEKNIIKLINSKIKKLYEKYNDVKIKINNNVIKEICDLSNYSEFGARQIDKIISKNLDNLIIDKIINGENIINVDSIKLKI
ncbi:MAG: AAA family ATPase [Bacilli bacterium]